MELKKGDVVRLKSSLQPMTIQRVIKNEDGPEFFECVWISDYGLFGKNEFEASFLVKLNKIVGEE